MDLFLQRLFDAVSNGSTYALVAVALVLIFKATTLINFAQGEMGMLGAFFGLQLWLWGLPMWIALIVAMILSAVLAAGIERVLIRPFDPADHLPLVIITLGLFLAINALAAIIWRFDPRSFPNLFGDGTAFSVGGANLGWYTVGTIVTVVVVLSLLQLLLTRTKIGLAFRAVSSNLESSELVGIRVGPTLQFGWALAAGVGTLAAAVFVANPIRQIEPTIMVRVLIFAAAAAALGGLDSLWGAVVGGVAIGLVQSVVVQYLNQWVGFPTTMSLAAAVFVLMLILLVRPAGLFGTNAVERV
ncbi:MAG: branched-chain amino acid ABC transporter permease [Actinomycetota bacterium]